MMYVQFCYEAKNCAYWLVNETLWHETETRPRHLIFSPRRDRDRDLPTFPRDRDETETRPRRLKTTSRDRLETETSRLRLHPWKQVRQPACLEWGSRMVGFAFCWCTCSCVVCFCCVRFSFFSATPSDWLGRTSLWFRWCRILRRIMIPCKHNCNCCNECKTDYAGTLASYQRSVQRNGS